MVGAVFCRNRQKFCAMFYAFVLKCQDNCKALRRNGRLYCPGRGKAPGIHAKNYRLISEIYWTSYLRQPPQNNL